MLNVLRLISVFSLAFLLNECETDSTVKTNNIILKENMDRSILSLRQGKQTCILIDISQITPFKWDSMYYFSGETSELQISNTIGFKWNGIGVLEDDRRLLFISKKRVISYIDFSKISLNERKSKKIPVHFYYCSEVNSNHAEVCSTSSAKFIVYKEVSQYGTEYIFINSLCKKYHTNHSIKCLQEKHPI